VRREAAKGPEVVALIYTTTAAPLPKDNFKNKAPILHWQRAQLQEHFQAPDDQLGFETDSTRALRNIKEQLHLLTEETAMRSG
jgi:hypothetical protein